MDSLDVKTTEIPKAEIRTEEQATRVVEDFIRIMQGYRALCNVMVPDPGETLARTQQKNLWIFLTKQGQAEGALKAFKLAGLISDKCYVELHQKAINSLMPTVVGG